MTTLALTMTDVGRQRFAQAQLGGDIDLSVASIGLTATVFAQSSALTTLPGEFRRLTTISGAVVGDNTIHLMVTDSEAIAYSATGFGLFLADGSLFAFYGQATSLFEKSTQTTLLLAIDIAFPVAGVEAITFGDASFLNPPATSTTRGVVELATTAEANAGSAGPLAITAAVLKSVLDILRGRTITGSGLVGGGGDLTANRMLNVTAATPAEALAGVSTTAAVTPASLVLILQALAASVPQTRKITGTGIIGGGGDLTQDRTIDVAIATPQEALDGASNVAAVTPASLALILTRLATAYDLASPIASLGNPGYLVLPGGLILQWGSIRAFTSGEGTSSATFPLAFPTACLGRAATPYISGFTNVRNLWLQFAGEASQFGFGVQYQGDSENNRAIDGFDWIAIGI